MKGHYILQPVALALSLLLTGPAFSPAGAEQVSALGSIISSPPAQLNGIKLSQGATLLDGDRLATGREGWARVVLSGGAQIHLSAATRAQARRRGEQVEMGLAEGRVALATNGNQVVIRSNGLAISPHEGRAVWEVAHLGPGVTRVTSRRGTVQVVAANRTLPVPAGRSAVVETTAVEKEEDDDDEGPVGALAGASLSQGEKVAITAGVLGGIAAIVVPLTVGRTGDEVSPSGL